MFRPLLEVEMSKKCTPLWREAHFQVKSVKNWGVRTTFSHSDVDNDNDNNNNNNYYYYYNYNYYYYYCYYYYYYYYY